MQYYLRKVWSWFRMHDFFSVLCTHSIRLHFCLGDYIYIYIILPWTFSIAFLSGLQIKSNRYIAELYGIIFCTYSTMYWIMLAHVLLLLFFPGWERMTVGAVNSLGFQHYWLNPEPYSSLEKRQSKCSLHKSIWSKVQLSGYSTIAHIILSA